MQELKTNTGKRTPAAAVAAITAVAALAGGPYYGHGFGGMPGKFRRGNRYAGRPADTAATPAKPVRSSSSLVDAEVRVRAAQVKAGTRRGTANLKKLRRQVKAEGMTPERREMFTARQRLRRQVRSWDDEFRIGNHVRHRAA